MVHLSEGRRRRAQRRRAGSDGERGSGAAPGGWRAANEAPWPGPRLRARWGGCPSPGRVWVFNTPPSDLSEAGWLHRTSDHPFRLLTAAPGPAGRGVWGEGRTMSEALMVRRGRSGAARSTHVARSPPICTPPPTPLPSPITSGSALPSAGDWGCGRGGACVGVGAREKRARGQERGQGQGGKSKGGKGWGRARGAAAAGGGGGRGGDGREGVCVCVLVRLNAPAPSWRRCRRCAPSREWMARRRSSLRPARRCRRCLALGPW